MLEVLGVGEPSAGLGVSEAQAAVFGVQVQAQDGAVAAEAAVAVGAHLDRRPGVPGPAVALQRRGEQAQAGGVESPVLAGADLQVDVGLVLQVPLVGLLRGDLQDVRRRCPRVPESVADVVLDGAGLDAEAHQHVGGDERRARRRAVVHVEVLAHEAVPLPREVRAQGAVGEKACPRVPRRLRHGLGGRVRHSRIHIGQRAHSRLPSRGPAAASRRRDRLARAAPWRGLRLP